MGYVEILETSWLRDASHPLAGKPVGWPRSARPIKKHNFPPKKKLKNAQKVPQKVPQKDPAPSWAIWGSLDFFEFFQNYTPPGGGQPKKVFRGYPQGPGGGPCQIWLESIQ